jgi:predicted HTH transcriptional regulator
MLEFRIPQLDVFDKRPEKVTERVTERVTENQAIIIREMEKNPFVTAIGLAKILGISLRKTKENIKKLQQKGLIRRIGPDKGGYWKVN